MPTCIGLSLTVTEIPDPGSFAFSVHKKAKRVEGFVVRRGGNVFAYRNQCPHTGAPLNWQEHVFLDSNEELIQCAMHGALFLPESGVCVRGPCAGQPLEKLELLVADDGKISIWV